MKERQGYFYESEKCFVRQHWNVFQIQRNNFTRLKNKIESNSNWEGAFYQSEWVKIKSIELFSFFHFMCVAANWPELFCVSHLADIECFLSHSKLSFWIPKFIRTFHQLELTKINSSARRCVFSWKWVKLTRDELFSVFKSEHI